MELVMEQIYRLDLYIAVSNVARIRGFNYAMALPKGNLVLKAAALSHPGLEKAVANPIDLHQDSNMLFLTGANMAGKSTFMKSFGIAIYLGHMGFPVAAEQMTFSIRDGIYSSINVPDNLALGLSHFYAEVLRVKKVAEEVSAGKDLIVIFDELFKGTNVKDAYDATLAVTEAFSQYRNCFFIISTHIIEVGETLRERCDNLQFAYLPTVMEGTVPRYTYKMVRGITTDRHGMMIIENEGILTILETEEGLKLKLH
jgi:DNA mismatch repair ATPase MutS